MKNIDFTTNWNGKLSAKCFTTIRLKSEKYVLGEEYLVTMKSNLRGFLIKKMYSNQPVDKAERFIIIGKFKIIQIESITWEQMMKPSTGMNRVFLMDTGYEQKSAVGIFSKMYANEIATLGNTAIFYILTLACNEDAYNVPIETFVNDTLFQVIPRKAMIANRNWMNELIEADYAKS
ncbi:MAG: hypothetical protein PSX81_02625 [bacterium]|nr:hypothetical protein [bacterium]